MPGMWWPHLINLFGRSWGNLVRATSTNTLGFILWTVAITAVSWVATFAARWVQLKREGRERPFTEAIRDSWLPAIFEAIAIGVLVLCLWGIFTGKTIYKDHQFQASTNAQLVADKYDLAKKLKDALDNAEKQCEQAKDADIRGLKRRIGEACYLPDRHLTERQRDELFHALKRLKAGSPKLATIMICTELPGDIESLNLTAQFQNVFHDAEWLVLGCDLNVLKGVMKNSMWRGIVITNPSPGGYVPMELSSTFVDMGFDVNGGYPPDETLHSTMLLVGYKVGYAQPPRPF